MPEITQDECLCRRFIYKFDDDCRNIDSLFQFTQAKYVLDLLFRQMMSPFGYLLSST
jgi:hypothetical protein